MFRIDKQFWPSSQGSHGIIYYLSNDCHGRGPRLQAPPTIWGCNTNSCKYSKDCMFDSNSWLNLQWKVNKLLGLEATNPADGIITGKTSQHRGISSVVAQYKPPTRLTHEIEGPSLIFGADATVLIPRRDLIANFHPSTQCYSLVERHPGWKIMCR